MFNGKILLIIGKEIENPKGSLFSVEKLEQKM
jgi:hypothetical protein